MAFDFTGRRVFVTGGSRGIAAAIVRAFAAGGAAVAFNFSAAADRQAGFPDAAADLARELRGAGRASHPLEADLLTPDVAIELADRVIAAFGAPEIVVLSASLQINQDFLAVTPRDLEAQLRVNLVANVQLLQRLIPEMRRAGRGRIIAIGSVQEVAPSGEMAVYAMTKAALENLVRNLAVENASYGITVNNVAPGLIQTDRNAFRRQDMEDWRRLAADANPLGRAGQPDDITGAVLFLASNEAAFVTGATIFATGGAHIPRSPTRKTV